MKKIILKRFTKSYIKCIILYAGMSRSLLPYARSLLPYIRSLLTLMQNSGMPVSVVLCCMEIDLFCHIRRSVLTRPRL